MVITKTVLEISTYTYSLTKEEKERYERETTLPFPIKMYGKTTLRKLAKVLKELPF